jgi:hypothetical protein
VDRITVARHKRVPTPALNRFIEKITTAHLPVSPSQRRVRVLYAAQTGVAPPTFVLFTNVATTLHFSYERYLQNQLREEYGFEGTPIRIHDTRTPRARARGKAMAERGSAESPMLYFKTRHASDPDAARGRAGPAGDEGQRTQLMAVPKRELFRSADVCEMVQVQPYVLRSWEAEFPGLGQEAAGGGPRVYRRPTSNSCCRSSSSCSARG